MARTRNNNQGFTLIEVLIVVVIIGILATLAIISLTSVRAKARDSKRISDIKQLQTALELYRGDNNTYPSFLNEGTPLAGPDGSTYMTKVPISPGRPDGTCQADTYTYTTSDPANTYNISYCLGGKIQTAGPKACVATPDEICAVCLPRCAALNHVCGDDSCGEECAPGCTDPSPYCSPDQTACLASPECPVSICGDCSSLICGATDFSANGSCTVTYNGLSTTYSAVKVGSQCWLDKAINLGTMIGVSSNMSDNNQVERWCFNNTESNCQNDGSLYTWAEAMYLPYFCNGNISDIRCLPAGYLSGVSAGAPKRRQGLCPRGWHIPSDYEFSILENSLDSSVPYPATPSQCNSSSHSFYADNPCGDTTINTFFRGVDVGTKIKAGGMSNLNFLLSGYRFAISVFYNQGLEAYYWSSTQKSTFNSWYRGLTSGTQSSRFSGNKLNNGFNLRCVRD